MALQYCIVLFLTLMLSNICSHSINNLHPKCIGGIKIEMQMKCKSNYSTSYSISFTSTTSLIKTPMVQGSRHDGTKGSDASGPELCPHNIVCIEGH